MKKIEQTFTVELTTEEIELLTTALHGEYKFIREHRKSNTDPAQAPRLYEKQNNLQTLRNSFAALVGRSYMGEDA